MKGRIKDDSSKGRKGKKEKVSHVSQEELSPLEISSFNDIIEKKDEIFQHAGVYFSKDRTGAPAEFEKAFKYAVDYILHCKSEAKDEAQHYDLPLFLVVLSDVLHVNQSSLEELFNYSPKKAEEEFQKIKKDPKPKKDKEIKLPATEKVLLTANLSVHSHEDKNDLIAEGKNGIQGVLVAKQKEDKPDLTDFSKWKQKKSKLVSLENFILTNLSSYTVSPTASIHPLFKTWNLSCYPLEEKGKVDLTTRFSAAYKLPEKESKYARPILDIEIVPGVGPCVRGYLTLASRPRSGKKDKDITQNPETGEVEFKDVNLMNFGDPLRAYTWVEDYIKNPEHGPMSEKDPIIRSFLIPLAEYKKAIKEVMLVDADRAPGQVRAGTGSLSLKAVENSLVSFTNREDAKPEDGEVIKLETLGSFLFGVKMHPKSLAEHPTIAHQHGRPIEESQHHYAASMEESRISDVMRARDKERKLTGWGHEPTSSIPKGSPLAKHVAKFGLHPAPVQQPPEKKKQHHEKPKEKEKSKGKEAQSQSRKKK